MAHTGSLAGLVCAQLHYGVGMTLPHRAHSSEHPSLHTPAAPDSGLPPVPWQAVRTTRNHAALAQWANVVKRDLAWVNWPAANWVPAPDVHAGEVAAGQTVLDVLVVGAGMCGQTATHALHREGVTRVAVIDAMPRGEEGPWGTYARMLTLRSPKHLTGPDLGLPSLTFRAWYEAQHGEAQVSHFDPQCPGWAGLHKVGRVDWRDYLLWVRDALGIEVRNGVRLVSVQADTRPTDAKPAPPISPTQAASVDGFAERRLLRVVVQTESGEQSWLCRKLVLAMGRDGSGGPRWPDFPSTSAGQAEAFFAQSCSPGAAASRFFHSSNAINFIAIKDRECWTNGQFDTQTNSQNHPNSRQAPSPSHIAVLGAGASAFDNAASALEAGCRVTLFCRRAALPQVNKSKWTAFLGCLRGFHGLPDATKWHIYTYIFSEQVPPPWETVRRCDAHPLFELRLGDAWLDVAADAAGVDVTTLKGVQRFDAVIYGTGFDVNVADRPETDQFTPHIDTWARHVSASEAALHAEASRFPYLGSGFELQSYTGEHAAAMANTHLFNWGATLSHGALAGDIPGLGMGATRLAQAIARDLFVQDAARHVANLHEHSEPELINTRRYVAPP